MSFTSGSVTLINNSGTTILDSSSSDDYRYVGGTICILVNNSGPAGVTPGIVLTITSHSGAVNSASITLFYDTGIEDTSGAAGTLDLEAGDDVYITTNPYFVKAAVNDATNVNQTPLGTLSDASGSPTLDRFRWIQTRGIAALYSNTAGTIAAGDELAIAGSGTGQGRVDTRVAFNEQLVGRALDATSGADEHFPCWINLE